MHKTVDVVVIGGGQAGLAAGYHLQKAGLSFVILEAGTEPVGSWVNYYESLRVFSPVAYSHLPGLPFPGQVEHYPSRDEVVAYLRHYATHFELPVLTHTWVERVSHDNNGFVTTAAAPSHPLIIRSQAVIAATGSFNRPHRPTFKGQETFRGQILHASEYQRPQPFKGQRIIVVGSGNSAIQIAAELSQVAHVTIASRQPVRFKRQRILGRDVHYWWHLFRLDTAPIATPQTAIKTSKRFVLDDGRYQAQLRQGKVAFRSMFERFTTDGAVWSDGTTETADTVLLATGYEPNVPYLSELGALDERGFPKQRWGVSQTVPGLYFVGLSGQRTYASATLRGVGADAAYVVAKIEAERAAAPCCAWPFNTRLAAA